MIWACPPKKTKQNKQLNKENKNKNKIYTLLDFYIMALKIIKVILYLFSKKINNNKKIMALTKI